MKKIIILLLSLICFDTALAQPVTTRPSAINMLTANCAATNALIGGTTSPACGPVFGSTNTASTIVQRDASGNFAAGTITASLTGSASLNLLLSGGTLTGPLLFTDNLYDIGASGATRPRTGYFGTSVISPLVNGLTITNNGTNTLNIATGKTLTNSNTLTFTGTDGSSVAFGAGGTVLYGNQSITLSGDVTGSGATAITTTLANIPNSVPAVGSILYSNIAAPVAPAAGKVQIYTDSTDLRLHDKNASGTIGTTVVADTGAANNFLTAISSAGVISKSQPTCSSLSDVAASCSTDTTNATNISSGNLADARMPNAAWTAYTPTVTCNTGTITTDSKSGRYKVWGKTTFIQISHTITTVGTCTAPMSYSLPNTSNNDVTVACQDWTSGSLCPALIGASGTSVQNYATPVDHKFVINSSYENQ